MAVGFLVRVLFGLALVAQVLSPQAAGSAMSAPNGSATASRVFCAMLHGASADAKRAAVAASEQAPKHDPAHRHEHCSFCQSGASGPPLHDRPPPTLRSRVSWARPLFVRYADDLVFFRIDRNAPARAPPSFA